MELAQNILYIGVNDKKIDLFEGMYKVPNGMAYNSYLIVDEKIAVMDSVDACFKEEWLNNLKNALGEKLPSYLIVQHMEPDHSANVLAFASAYPNAKIVSTKKAFAMMQNYFGTDFSQRQVVVADGDELCLGAHTLKFLTAPMVHWPEVMLTYDKLSKTLFSADAFGKFGALDTDEDWACEARRYYFGIVGKYGVQVQGLLKKLAGVDISYICPLHGPVLSKNLGYYLNLYNIWSSYGVESEGVVIAYTSVYGNTKKAVNMLAQKLKDRGVKVVVNDLARCDMHEAVEDAFRYGKIVLATTTYNGDAFPFMREFLHNLTERNFQNRTVAFMENGTWMPMATKVMRAMLENCKSLNYTQSGVKILSALNEESTAQIDALANELHGAN
ncbi:MAG: FprA family A-type flavoprotein [Clostridiales bacterium]|nr:FprA family A-type flavoprotein [Clostridiales bacterium]